MYAFVRPVFGCGQGEGEGKGKGENEKGKGEVCVGCWGVWLYRYKGI